jgi:hypothetical protein
MLHLSFVCCIYEKVLWLGEIRLDISRKPQFSVPLIPKIGFRDVVSLGSLYVRLPIAWTVEQILFMFGIYVRLS